MRAVLPVTTLLLSSLPALLAGCGPGAAAEAIRPNDPTAAAALGEAECREVGKTGEPLVVDWKPDQRGDLEIAMREGVAVVSYSCEGIKLLKDCHLKESKDAYRFMGMTKKEQVVRLQNADELKANLPFSGGAIGGELARGSSLDIAMIMVGKTKTTWKEPTKDDLEGECDGATHFVRGATLGAFAVDSGTSAKVRAAAEIFGASAGAGSSSEKSVGTKEGDLSDCAKASPSSEAPPPQCGAPIRLVLQMIAKEPPKAPAEGLAQGAGAEIEAPELSCPKGLVLADGKCTSPASAAAYQCDPQSAEECKAQCDKGHAGSCGTLGAMLMSGRGAERDPAKAAEVLKKACDGGDAPGCVRLGALTSDKDAAAAAKLFEKGCNDGEAAGCGLLGRAYLAGKGVSADPAKAAQLLDQGCDGGDIQSCAAAGPLHAEGKGVQADLAKAAQYYRRACDGGDAPSCGAIGQMFETGRGAGKNAIIAGMYYMRGCVRAHGDSCLGQGRVEVAKPNGGNADMARRAFEQACTWRSSLGCAVLKAAYGQNRPVIPDVAQQMAMRKSCDGGNATDCANVGLLAVASGNKVGGKMDLDRACQRGEAFACFVAKQVK